MFTAALFTTERARKQPKCPVTNEQIKMCYIHATGYYSATKRGIVGSFVEIWMKLGSVIQNEVRKRK